MIEKLDPHDGRYITLIEKMNEMIDEVNSLRRDFEASVQNFDHHHHDYLNIPEEDNKTSYPVVTMVNESGDQL